MKRDFSRQSFLGENSEERIAQIVVGIVGLGGGGSHIAQQLAHVGFERFVLFDADEIHESNLNRLIGGTDDDVRASAQKVEIAARLIRSVQPHAHVESHVEKWQERPTALKRCDIIFGCLDSFADRDQLETLCRRNLVPLIDIGLGVQTVSGHPPFMGGQVLLSLPGHPCMRCLGFITDAALADEASRYGDAGARPQVVFANGVLSSAAVGIAVDLVTDWTRSLRETVYLEYRGNEQKLGPHPRLAYALRTRCVHYPDDALGDPRFIPL